VQSSPALDDHHLPDQPDPVPTIPAVPPIPGYLIAAVVITTAVGLMVLAEIAAPAAAAPDAIRELSIGLAVAAWAICYMHRAEARLRAAIHMRLHGVCCAEAYVAGLARKPLPASMADGRHLHSAG
jgi:hypothetical protein